MRVQEPVDIITEIDSIVRASRVQYRELSNSGLKRLNVQSIEDLEIPQFFRQESDVKPRRLEAKLKRWLSQPLQFSVQCIRSDTGESLAVFVVKNEDESFRSIEYFRTASRLRGTRFGSTLTDYIADQPLGAWRSRVPRVLRIADSRLDPPLTAACLERGFLEYGGELWRVSLPGIWSESELKLELSRLCAKHSLPAGMRDFLTSLVERASGPGGFADALELERLIHPGKITFANIPSFVLPIRPEWARELFDFRIWDLPLFAPATELVINPDSVYYKRPRNSPAATKGRILWYVSGAPSKGAGSVRACSAMTNLVKGTVKDLFRRFERLGVFEWRQLMDYFESENAEAVAIEFTRTELLEHPIDFQRINTILEDSGMKRQTFQSALRVDDQAFQRIYEQASNGK